MVHWCRHYGNMPIDRFRICLNVNSGIDDSELFTGIFKNNLSGKDVVITIDNHSFGDGRKKDFMNSFVKPGIGEYFIPNDCDEFIDFNLATEIDKLANSKYQSVNGKLVDMVCLEGDKLNLKSPNLDTPILEQFPTEHDISAKIKRGMHKICLIKGGNELTGGHHYYAGHAGNNVPQPHIKVRHYCWTNTTHYNRSHSTVAWHPIYKKICEITKLD